MSEDQKSSDEREEATESRRPTARPASDQVREAVDKARDAYERTRPQVERLVREATPRVQKAAKDAIDYARDHDEELKAAGKAIIRSQARGPWRVALGAFENATTDRRQPQPRCESCGTEAVSLTAKFCSECGARLGGNAS